MTTLFEAASKDDAAMAARLLKSGADKEATNASGHTALIYAAQFDSVKVAKLLIEAGADKEAKLAGGFTALMISAYYGSAEVAKLLVDGGADMEAVFADGSTALIIAAEHGFVEVAKLLVEAGADKEATKADGATALIKAAKFGCFEVAKLLVEAGADMEAMLTSGFTALMVAAAYDSVEVAKLLVEAGADKEAKRADGSTALMVAAQSGSVEVATALVEAGAYKEAKRADGFTALIVAAEHGSGEVATVLVEAGADKEAKTAKGNNACALARKCNHPALIAVLDPAAAAELGRQLLQAFEQATLVHVISTRYQRDQTQLSPHVRQDKCGHPLSCDPFVSAQEVKRALEKAGPSTCVFDPNGDNAFLMGEHNESANAIWLNNWRWALERAHQTGGCCVQVVVKPGLSMMQKAEAEMAAEKGVRIVRLDCSEVIQRVNLEAQVDSMVCQAAYKRDLVRMPGWAELTALARQAADGSIPKPLSRQELEEENAELRSKLGIGPRSPPQRKRQNTAKAFLTLRSWVASPTRRPSAVRV